MKKYRCIKGFIVDNYDGDGFLVENSVKVVDEGELYIMNDEVRNTIIGGEVHLDNIDDGSWLEITREHLREFFEEVD